MEKQYNLRIIAPSLFPEIEINEAEVLGGFFWLWNQEAYYKKSAVDSALETIMPIIRSKNFAFFILNDSPIGYLNWAYLDEEAENNYLKKEKSYVEFVQHSQFDNNKKIWILSWFCPTGKSNNFLMRTVAKNIIFKNQTIYYGYHKSPDTTLVRKLTG